MVMNEAVPRLSAGPFSGIMGILESAAIECLSINVEPITIEKLSSESLYSGKGGADTSIHCRFALKEEMFHGQGVFRCRLSSG